ncbi:MULTISPECIES: cupin domain-containing protein [Chryseobacterium]|uniref:Uncharacterized protein YjlB n=1 Tax=Chryseobacterium camelliae TaxID=1265445 RepID=A0ABU0TGR3_9FLAO|nr:MULTISPECIES: cupin domain-containing protein [Chryseobacterium]MDT3405947.1 uncharacterized protein YjlB [Pseudacidovorax intermedius]MDQ1096249.1 uncharacterized protein YjlB [Chryseobacterium camelliae]MDQ1100186.1 uncharacterized protein YjlB [Chryseobacterium sp. SORGH_AS_1048]MDR6087530.1 uncharacterized protein YjlB [Chryseobacterium sp. SORGH_AS_0909]MDR6131905.1 uncharacterized protein YjlB [Chryseobacterium sp. SORGH_AS_1175]
MRPQSISPETYIFRDDGKIPNSNYPILVYRNVFSGRGTEGALWLEHLFKENGWHNFWKWTIYSFHHYHSNTHEVLGVFQGSAEICLGGPTGKKIMIEAGDILVIPAGVAHKCISSSDGFTVVGAYPEGKSPDLIRAEESNHDTAVLRIQQVTVPEQDPVLGNAGGLLKLWI